MKITKIDIKNFRSIKDLSIDCDYFTIFVGRNDVGKSNIIRALNLFFNNETDFNTPFDYTKDYSTFAETKRKKAKEIYVKLTIELPKSYWVNKRKNIVWIKKWRSTSEKPIEIKHFEDGTEFESYSKIPTLLQRIRFRYVPALKDLTFFKNLLAEVYTVLSAVAAEKLRSSAKNFEKELSANISELTDSVKGILNIESKLTLPSNLSHIFENLDFQAESISLSARGDGIKARHIPVILSFIGDKQNEKYGMGSIWSYQIWGYEEPENNVELSSCYEMAKQFLEYVYKDIAIFATTHSPAFYSLVNEDYTKVIPIRKINSSPTEIHAAKTDDLDIDLGLMPFVAPYIEEKQKQLDAQKQIYLQIKADLDDLKKPALFVEGPTDQIVINKTINVLLPEYKGKILVIGSDQTGGYNFVKDRVVSWCLHHKHSSTSIKGAGLFDSDEDARKAKSEANDLLSKLNPAGKTIARAFSLTKDKKLIDLVGLGFDVPADLETLYSSEFWNIAEENDWLCAREDFSKIMKKSAINKMMANKDILHDLTEEQRALVESEFDPFKKLEAAKYIESSTSAEATAFLKSIQVQLKPILDFLIKPGA